MNSDMKLLHPISSITIFTRQKQSALCQKPPLTLSSIRTHAVPGGTLCFPTHTQVVYMLPFNHISPHTYRVMCYTYSPVHTLSSIRWYALFLTHMPAVSCISPPKHMCNQILVGTARHYVPCKFQTNGYSNVNPVIFKMSRWRVCMTWTWARISDAWPINVWALVLRTVNLCVVRTSTITFLDQNWYLSTILAFWYVWMSLLGV